MTQDESGCRSSPRRKPSRACDLLEAPEQRDLLELSTWWSHRDEVFAWAGPKFRFPFTPRTFREDLRLPQVTSRVIVLPEEGPRELVAFGQLYAFRDRVHLARLAVAPDHRSRGWGGQLVRGLVTLGQGVLQLQEASLYVKEGNLPARRCYQSEGFEVVEAPNDERLQLPGMEDVLFMVRRGTVRAGASLNR